MSGNWLLVGIVILLVVIGIGVVGYAFSFREKALADAEEGENDPKKVTEAQKMGVLL